MLLPEILKLITFDEDFGLLNGFKIKSDGISFLEKIISSIDENSKINLSPINNHPLKGLFEILIEVLQKWNDQNTQCLRRNGLSFDQTKLFAILVIFMTLGANNP